MKEIVICVALLVILGLFEVPEITISLIIYFGVSAGVGIGINALIRYFERTKGKSHDGIAPRFFKGPHL